MNESKEPKIYVDIGIVDSSDLSPDKVPDDFWSKMAWLEKYNERDDLELHIFKKDNRAVLNRLLGFAEDDKDEAVPRFEHNGILKDKGDHLSLTSNVLKWGVDYENVLIDRLIRRLQSESEDDKYLLDMVNICVYMQKVDSGREDISNRLMPLDIKQFSAYTNIIGTIIDCAEINHFNGLRCEYILSGHDRCALGLFIEDGEDRWDGMRYQINFHISLYQMPGVFSGSVTGREIQNIESQESYALDCVIASGDKCDSFADFRKWADALFFGYRV